MKIQDLKVPVEEVLAFHQAMLHFLQVFLYGIFQKPLKFMENKDNFFYKKALPRNIFYEENSDLQKMVLLSLD